MPKTLTMASVVLVAVSACGSGAAKVLVQDSTSPASHATTVPSPAAVVSASPRVPGAGYGAYGGYGRTAATTPKPKPKATTTTAAAAAKATPKSTATRAVACASPGPTTVLQVTTPDRFSPPTLTVNRCDAVKAVYSDPTGTPHTWQGPSWASGDLSASGQSYTYRFTSSGTFTFFCAYHRSAGMTGTIIVR